ncbi:MAG: response regulator [Desulfovibrio sp.]|jgi:PAS domain S-box-containing protein|nr:response regulator [Desulfovibrio sp.]
MGTAKGSILVVDDENFNLLTLNKILTPAYRVFTAKSGEQALKLLEMNLPDIILLDVVMPGMDGFDMIAQLKAEERTARIPVIFITGLDNEVDEEKGFLLGAADYIRKPFKEAIVKARITTQMRIVRQMRLSEDDLLRMSSVSDSSPQFMVFINADGRIEYMNPAVSQISGYSREEILSQGLELFFSDENSRKLHMEYLRGAAERRNHNFEMELIRKNGEIRVLSFSTFASVLHNGEMGTGMTGSDITEMKRIEGELIQAKVQAEYYNKAKTNFLSRMSHEMRTPMNAVMGMTSIARTARDDARRTYCYDRIEQASAHLLRIIDDILDMSRIEMGTFVLAERKFSFNAAMESVVVGASRFAAAKGINFEVFIDEKIPDRMTGDPNRLKQALGKLLDNAVLFTPEKGVIALSVHRLEDAAGKCVVRFEVSDTGPGMSDETLLRLWDAFEQADNTITRAHGGTGLGLPITKHIIEAMEGTIRVDSTPGKGSRFEIVARFSYEVDQVAVAEGAHDGPTLPLMTGKRILVVDDVDMNREIVQALLNDSGALLDMAADGAEAVRKFSENHYDVILMDLHMPVMDGFEAARRIRALGIPGADVVRIIALTADTGGDVLARCLEAGMNDHLGKPVEPATLTDMIEMQLAAVSKTRAA